MLLSVGVSYANQKTSFVFDVLFMEGNVEVIYFHCLLRGVAYILFERTFHFIGALANTYIIYILR